MGGNDGHSFLHRIHMYNINAQQTGKLRLWTEVPGANMKWNTRRLSSNTNTKMKTIHKEADMRDNSINPKGGGTPNVKERRQMENEQNGKLSPSM